jgi:phosphatidylglycerophosphatase A
LGGSRSLSVDELTSQFNDFNSQVIVSNSLTASQYFAQSANKNKMILRNYINSIEDLEQASLNGLMSYQEQSMNAMQSRAKGLLNVIKNIGANLLLVVGTQLASKAYDWIVEDVLTNTKRHKDKIAKIADEAISSFDERVKQNLDNKAQVESIAADFKKLSAGVSVFGDNLSLTNEQYDKYKSYVNQLIEINPSLIEGINAQGDAYINNNEALKETLELLKQQERYTYVGFFNGTDNVNVFNKYVDDYVDATKQIAELKSNSDPTDNNIYGNLMRMSDQLSTATQYSSDVTDRQIEDLRAKYNLYEESIKEYPNRISENLNNSYANLITDIENIQGLDKASKDSLKKAVADNQDYISNVQQQENRLESLNINFNEYMDKYARSLKDYYLLSSQQTKLLDSYIEQYGFMDRINADGSNAEEIENQMRGDANRYAQMLTRLSQDTVDALSNIDSLDTNKLSLNEYKKSINDLLQEIVDDPNYDESLMSKEMLKISLGVSFETNDGQVKNAYDNKVENIINRLKQDRAKYNDPELGLIDNSITKKLNELTVGQIEKLYSTEDFSQFNTWQSILDHVTGVQTFDITSYQDAIDNIIKDLDKLGEANAKLINGDLTPNADGAVKYVMELAKEFPELNKYIDYGAENFGNLGKGIEDVIQHRPDSLLKMWDSLGNLTDSARRDVDNYRKAIKKLQEDAMGGNLTWISRLGLTEQDYLNYVVKDYDKIIKRLQDEKDGLGDVNDELTEQKEKLDKIVDEYKIAGDTVIKQLDDKISDVNDYYDEQIDKLKTENEELERSLELQQKQAALANAQKRKVRVLTETEGWVWKNDNQGIRDAEKDLKDTETNIRTAELEKQRDDEIKLWEDYKDAWQDAMDAYTKAHDEAITDGILGSDWRDNVMARDEDMLNNYEVSYSNFQYQLNDDIGKQIEANNEYEKSIDKKIKKYEDDKKAIQDWVDQQEESNDRYFGLLDEVKVTENSTWNERLANFEEFKNNYLAIKAQLENEDISKMYAVEFNGKTAGFYNSESEARAAAKSLVNAKVNYATANNPSARTSSNIAHLRDEAERLIRILAPGSYSNGGVIDYTGVANVHGSPNKSEVALNSSQAGEVYSFIKSGMLSKATDAMTAAYNSLIDLLPKPKLGNLINPMLNLPRETGNFAESKPLETSNEINISFAGANINAESYESFKDYMDRYTGDLLLQLQTGKK